MTASEASMTAFQDAAIAAIQSIDPAIMSMAFRRGYALSDLIAVPMTEATLAEVSLREAAIYSGLEGAMMKSAVNQFGRKPACGAGCSMCCFQTFEPSTVEVMAIACYLLENGIADRVLERAIQHLPNVGRLTQEQRYAAHIPCPALEKNNCSVYAVRPRVCRTYYSMSRTACHRDFRLGGKAPKNKQAGVPLLTQPGVLGTAIGFGIDLAFLEKGFEVDRVEYTAALVRVLEAPETIIPAWLAGERVFDGVPRRRRTFSDLAPPEYSAVLYEVAHAYDVRTAKLGY